MHHTSHYCNLLYCTSCVKEHFTVNRGSLSLLSTAGDQFNEAAIPAVSLWHFDLLRLTQISFCGLHIHVPQEPSHMGVLGILQVAGLLRPLLWDRLLTRVVRWDYFETDSRRFSCSMEGQAMIWISSELNSSFSRAWNFWKTC